jgi:hypothetical protein
MAQARKRTGTAIVHGRLSAGRLLCRDDYVPKVLNKAKLLCVEEGVE